jgi:hypothetical protein
MQADNKEMIFENQNNEREIADTVYLSSAYLAPVQYYSKLVHYPHVCLEAHCNYIKQTYRTRCDILAANGVLTLSIPVDKGDMLKCPTKDIRISDAIDWQRQHWKSIESAYRTSPFFDYYEDDFRPFYEKRWDFLFDFNNQIQAQVLSLLEYDIKICQTDDYKQVFASGEIDLRDEIHPKKELNDPHFFAVQYYQVFQERFGFVPNLSVLDLLFNMGPEARIILRKSWI